MSHTIVLVQTSSRMESRTYKDFESTDEAMEGICHLFESHLKKANPTERVVTYDVSQLFRFIDQLTDLVCLVSQENARTYVPHPKDWIKEKIYVLLRKVAKKVEP